MKFLSCTFCKTDHKFSSEYFPVGSKFFRTVSEKIIGSCGMIDMELRSCESGISPIFLPSNFIEPGLPSNNSPNKGYRSGLRTGRRNGPAGIVWG